MAWSRSSTKQAATEHKIGFERAFGGSCLRATDLLQTPSGRATSSLFSTSATAITAATSPVSGFWYRPRRYSISQGPALGATTKSRAVSSEPSMSDPATRSGRGRSAPSPSLSKSPFIGSEGATSALRLQRQGVLRVELEHPQKSNLPSRLLDGKWCELCGMRSRQWRGRGPCLERLWLQCSSGTASHASREQLRLCKPECKAALIGPAQQTLRSVTFQT